MSYENLEGPHIAHLSGGQVRRKEAKVSIDQMRNNIIEQDIKLVVLKW